MPAERFEHCGRANCQRCNEEADHARDAETPTVRRPESDRELEQADEDVRNLNAERFGA